MKRLIRMLTSNITHASPVANLLTSTAVKNSLKPSAKSTADAAAKNQLRASLNDAGKTFSDLASTKEGRDRLATALDGKTRETRTVEQQRKIDNLLDKSASGQMPKFKIKLVDTASQEDIENGKAPSNALPKDIPTAYVPSEGQRKGTILFDKNIPSNAFLPSHFREEMGESIADAAKRMGINVAKGDVGDRLARTAGGANVDPATEAEVFKAAKDDQVTVNFDGKNIQASAAGKSHFHNIQKRIGNNTAGILAWVHFRADGQTISAYDVKPVSTGTLYWSHDVTLMTGSDTPGGLFLFARDTSKFPQGEWNRRNVEYKVANDPMYGAVGQYGFNFALYSPRGTYRGDAKNDGTYRGLPINGAS